HLGHNRSVQEIVNCAIQEDVQAIAVTSYHGGNMEFFRYMYDLLQQRGAGHIRLFGGGGVTILPEEIAALQDYGITRIFSPDDGREMGLQGMITELLRQCDFEVSSLPQPAVAPDAAQGIDQARLARLITCLENQPERIDELLSAYAGAIRVQETGLTVPVVGITGTGGAGKSSLTDELVRRYLADFPDHTLAILSVDPSKRKTG